MRRADPFDPDNLRLQGELFRNGTAKACRPTKPPRRRPGEQFLKGPIPWPWLEVAAKLPGKALALSLCLWREAGRRHQRTVRVCLSRVELGISKQAARRGLV